MSSQLDAAKVDRPETPAAPLPGEVPDFSLVLGGPLHQLLRATHLSNDVLTLVHRRILVGVLITWVPLLLLSMWESHAWRGDVRIPFLLDAATNARFLIALPLVIVAELAVHMRTRRVVAQFFERDLISEADRPRFNAATESAMRLRNSLVAELLLVVLVYTLSVAVRDYLAVEVGRWSAGPETGNGAVASLSLAGRWQVLISLPIFQFLFARWYFRLFIWTRFLWQVSRIDLRLVPTHPDGAGGLGFLATVVYAFTPLLLAHGVVLAGFIANRIFFEGATLPQFVVEIAGGVGVLVFLVLCPLMVFAGQLARAKRKGLGEYGVFAQRYVREFDAKWLHGGRNPDEELLGSGDIQSLADLGNSFGMIKSMGFVPFSKQTAVQLGFVTIAPLAPLLLTMISLEELLKRLLGAMF